MGQACCSQEAGHFNEDLEGLEERTLPRLASRSASHTRRAFGKGGSFYESEWQGSYNGEIVNGMVKATWPLINDFSKHVMEETVLPAVKASLGSMADKFKVDMNSFSLGDKAIEFGELQIGETVQHTSDPEHPEMRVLMLRTPIIWHAHLGVHVSFASIKVGVSRLKLEGDLLMELIGSTPRPPLYQGARACFMNAPKIALEYDEGDGALNKLANLPSMQSAILKAVTQQVSNKLVVPNRMGVRLDPACEIFRIVKPRPKGILRVTFTRAENLIAMDPSLFHKATSDPMIQATCGALSFQSPTIMKTTSPVFDYVALLPIDFPREQKIDVKLMDHDTFTGHDCLGTLPPLAVSELIALGSEEKGYDLLDENKVAGKNGRIYLKAEFRPLLITAPTMPKDSPNFCDASEVFIGIYGANNLPGGPPGTKYWVTVQCSHRLGLGGHDINKPRMTPKNKEKEQHISMEEQAQRKKLFEAKRKICKEYKMSDEDMAALLDVEVGHLDCEDPHEAVHHDVDWNNALDFFCSHPHKAVVDLTLHCEYPTGQVSKEKSDHERAKQAHLGYLSKVKQALRSVSLHSLTGAKDDQVLFTWQIQVADILKDTSQPCRILEVPNTSTTLRVRLQVRSLGEITTDVT